MSGFIKPTDEAASLPENENSRTISVPIKETGERELIHVDVRNKENAIARAKALYPHINYDWDNAEVVE